MASGDGYAPLTPVSDTLSPLPKSHRNGLIAVSTLGFLSFLSTTTLFFYLSYKLATWQLKQPRIGVGSHEHNPATDLSTGFSQAHLDQSKPTAQSVDPRLRQTPSSINKKPLNQFLLLIYSLLFAEMHQSMAFLLNSSWVGSNAILVGTPTCWTQGWFVSVGDLAASCFVSAIAVHTYLTVIKGYKPRQWAVYATIGGIWIFAYALGIIGILITNNGRDGGGLYVRATAWCWMNVKYENFRLWLHYLWIFVSLALTSCLYVLIFFTLQHRNQSSRRLPRSHTSPGSSREAAGRGSKPGGNYPGFLIYPVIYVLCTAPLALGRVAAMAGTSVSVEYFCFAGSMIASNGWLDVLLFSSTRGSIIFGASPDSEDMGLNTFTFLRTPRERRYGNMIWVQGGAHGENNDSSRWNRRHRGWWKVGGNPIKGAGRNGWAHGPNSVSQQSLRGATMNDHSIQMDTVTSVVVEIEPDRKEPADSVGSS